MIWSWVTEAIHPWKTRACRDATAKGRENTRRGNGARKNAIDCKMVCVGWDAMNPKPSSCSRRSVTPPDESPWKTRAFLSPDCATWQDDVVTHSEEDGMSRLVHLLEKVRLRKRTGSFRSGSDRGVDFYSGGSLPLPMAIPCAISGNRKTSVSIPKLFPRFFERTIRGSGFWSLNYSLRFCSWPLTWNRFRSDCWNDFEIIPIFGSLPLNQNQLRNEKVVGETPLIPFRTRNLY